MITRTTHNLFRFSLWISCWMFVLGWAPTAPHKPSRMPLSARNRGSETTSVVKRLSLAGVSVSPQGFWVIYSVPEEGFWPVQITSTEEDASAATSPEALTILQLISGVDMAGAILPPDILARMSVLQSEQRDDFVSRSIITYVKDSLPKGANYSESHPWFQSRVRLPQVTLDGVQMNPLSLECVSRGIGQFSLTLTEDILKAVCFNYDEVGSETFMAVALALRYKAPIQVTGEVETIDQEELSKTFPLFKSADNLFESSKRVTKSIERGFEYHKLSGALRIAMERGDQVAAERIQEKLDEFDSLDDLLTLDDGTDGLDLMQ
eukprot:CAMPEP_0116572478 /NCGR_PEP_ID=MMETSP0397-20121206/18200_1 /TAXON_ID=216820 /ORGANISM="Cyclophora tenuis, Strain ECT3854" /LENGTH=320 /DNA_ID=CAMNT_0004100815 /DNA_START=173 /DNA_END=1135 /DNA_ORIENTATION=+